MTLLNRFFQSVLVVLCSFGMFTALTLASVPQTAYAGGVTLDPAIEPGRNDCNRPAAQLNSNNCGIIKYVVQITNVLSGIVGVVIVGSIIWGGILYSASGSDPGAVAAARKRIRNAIIALLIYIFSFAFIQWLIPGGVLN